MPASRVSDAVLDAALRKAVEAGVFPRRSTALEAANNREVMNSILHAAFTAARDEEPETDAVSTRDTRSSSRVEIRGLH